MKNKKALEGFPNLPSCRNILPSLFWKLSQKTLIEIANGQVTPGLATCSPACLRKHG
jgi:hypothetical protein